MSPTPTYFPCDFVSCRTTRLQGNGRKGGWLEQLVSHGAVLDLGARTAKALAIILQMDDRHGLAQPTRYVSTISHRCPRPGRPYRDDAGPRDGILGWDLIQFLRCGMGSPLGDRVAGVAVQDYHT